MLVPAACPKDDGLRTVDLSVMLLDGEKALLPDDRIARIKGNIGEILTHDDFAFKVPPTLESIALAESDPDTNEQQVREPIDLRPQSLRFDWTGGEARKRDARLVILLFDQSATLVGKDPENDSTAPELDRATDPNDERIAFFEQLVRSLPDQDFISVVPFNGSLPPNLDGADPTRNRDVVVEALQQLAHNEREQGGTPLALALDTVFDRIINFESTRDLNPVVVLFTDGVEGGDTSGSLTLEAVTERYVTRTIENDDGERVDAPVPVIVLHLQPPLAAAEPPLELDRGRSPALMSLACRTGGEYLFVESHVNHQRTPPTETDFSTDPNLSVVVRNRVAGAWRLTVDTALHDDNRFPPGGYLITAELGLTLGQRSVSTPLIKARDDAQDVNDTRVWLYK